MRRARFFSPGYMLDVQEKYQDPGVIENNAVTLMPAELQAYFGPSRVCQFLLNVGTGSAGSRPKQTSRNEYWGFLADLIRQSAVHRIVSAYSYLLSGSGYWGKYLRSLGKTASHREKCIRLDVTFDEGEPRLDDVRAMAALKARVQRDAALSIAIGRMARRLVASLFYFELDQRPQQFGCMYYGSGTIKCLRKSDDPALPLLINKVLASKTKFYINDKTIELNLFSAAVWTAEGNFAVAVPLQLVSPEFSIALRWPDGTQFPISGAPFTLPQLVRAQGLDCFFGLPGPRQAIRVENHTQTSSALARCRKRQRSVERQDMRKKQKQAQG